MYSYDREKSELNTVEGKRLFQQVNKKVESELSRCGAVMSGSVMDGLSGSCWTMLACFDRLIELGVIKEVTPPETWGQAKWYRRAIE